MSPTQQHGIDPLRLDGHFYRREWHMRCQPVAGYGTEPVTTPIFPPELCTSARHGERAKKWMTLSGCAFDRQLPRRKCSSDSDDGRDTGGKSMNTYYSMGYRGLLITPALAQAIRSVLQRLLRFRLAQSKEPEWEICQNGSCSWTVTWKYASDYDIRS